MRAQRVTMRALALSAILAADLLLCPCSGLADENQPTPIVYLESREQVQTLDSYVCLDETTSRLCSGWYVASGNVCLSDRLEIEGDVNLVLCDGCTITAGSGLALFNCARLKLYAQSDASGQLVILGGVTIEWNLDAGQIVGQPEEMDRIVGATQLDVEVSDQIVSDKQSANDIETEKAADAVKLDESLFSKPFICVRPTLTPVDSSQNQGVADVAQPSGPAGNGQKSSVSDARTSPSSTLSDAQSPTLTTASDRGTKVTVTFDPNGGFGTMSSMQVAAGESFTLPECTFDPPSGKVFDSWSLGKPGSNVSVPSSTTVRAWWKKATSSNGGGSTSSTSDGSNGGGSSSSTSDGNSSQSSSQQGGQGNSNSQDSQDPTNSDANNTSTAGDGSSQSSTNGSTSNADGSNAQEARPSDGSSTQETQQGTAPQESAAGNAGNVGGANDSSGATGGSASASAGDSTTGSPSAGGASPNTGDATVSSLSVMLISAIGVATIAEGVALRFERRARPAHAR